MTDKTFRVPLLIACKTLNKMWSIHKNIIIYMISALINPPGRTAKVIYGTLLVATLAVFVFYTSVFTSFLAYRDLKMPIRNLHELIENRDYKTITLQSTVYEAIFRVSQHSNHKIMCILLIFRRKQLQIYSDQNDFNF